MLNSNQEVIITTLDKRILPITGLITVRDLFKFCGGTWPSPSKIDDFIEKCEENHIFIFKLSQEPGTWLIRLDDFE